MILEKRDKEKIYHSALEILEKIGMEVHHQEGLSLLKEAGATMKDNRVFLKPYFVEKAVHTAPSYIPIYDRNGEISMRLGSEENYFGTGSDCPYTLDPFTSRRRPSTLEDVKHFSTLADSLPNIDFQMSMALPSDVPQEIADLHQFKVMVENSTKPIVFTSADSRNTKQLIEMAQVVVGGEKELVEKPFFIQYTEPSSPLVATEDALDRLLLSAQYGIPATFTSGAMPGASTPATIAGTVALCMAEQLSGLVIAQLKNPGAPIILGGAASPLDMRTAISSYGAPASVIIDLALCEVSKYLGIPVFSEAGFSDSKLPDAQVAIEASLSIFALTFSEADLVHDVGYMESGQTSSVETVVIGDQIIGSAKYINSKIKLDEEHFALEAIERVGPGGNYLTDSHTLRFFKETYMPELMDRNRYEDWEKEGGKSLSDRAREKAVGILDNHKPELLSSEKTKELKNIIKKQL